jgi:SAM-dependent methyltransferase
VNEREVKQLWEGNARAWIAGVRAEWDVFRRWFHDPAFYPLLGPVAGLDVLDAGCGEGVTCRRLAQRGARVTGLDISETLIASAQQLERERPLGIRYHVASFHRMDALEPESFDRIVSVMALMDAPGVEKTFVNMRRLLRPGGVLVFSVMHPLWDRRGADWEIDAAGKPALRLGDYFDAEPWESRWAFTPADGSAPHDPFRIVSFPRTLSTYVNALAEAGFCIERFAEPRPDLKACPPETSKVLERWQTIPFYLMVRASCLTTPPVRASVRPSQPPREPA